METTASPDDPNKKIKLDLSSEELCDDDLQNLIGEPALYDLLAKMADNYAKDMPTDLNSMLKVLEGLNRLAENFQMGAF